MLPRLTHTQSGTGESETVGAPQNGDVVFVLGAPEAAQLAWRLEGKVEDSLPQFQKHDNAKEGGLGFGYSEIRPPIKWGINE